MMLNAGLLILLGIICLLGAIITLIFTVISFANNKPSKFNWLAIFFVTIITLIICIVVGVKKIVNKVADITSNSLERFQDFNGDFDQYNDSIAGDRDVLFNSSKQIKLLKSYYPDSSLVRNEFYSYLGFQNYYRLPLRYPYSIHCLNVYDSGELFNEKNVDRFDENDNGEIDLKLVSISKLAFDKQYLLIEQNITSTRSEKVVQHFILFSFETEKKEEASSLNKLLQLAKEKGYTGPDTLMTVGQYHSLF